MRPRHSLFALVTALVAGILLTLAPADGRPARPQVRTVATVWPDARRADVPGALPDGAAYSPAYFLDERASVGTALDPRGGALRLVLRAADGTVRELRRLPIRVGPRFAGFTRAGSLLAWAESTTTRTELWQADLVAGTTHKITGDAGTLQLLDSEYDLQIASGRLYWTVVVPGGAVTEVRSAPLGGGPVEVRREPGAWALSTWPWLVGAGDGPSRLRNLDSGQVVTVKPARDEQITCRPSWCRVLVLPHDGKARTDLMRPDGSSRRRVPADGATAAIVDVAVLDRFEVLSGDSSTLAAALGGQRLYVYDAQTRRLATVTEAAVRVLYGGGVLWWSTGDGDTTAWHTLDLRSL